jgi:hypothetical protein
MHLLFFSKSSSLQKHPLKNNRDNLKGKGRKCVWIPSEEGLVCEPLKPVEGAEALQTKTESRP